MKTKQIEQILAPLAPHMVGDGFRVHNFFPSGYQFELNRLSPFFLLDYNSKFDFGPRDIPRGVGVHPHRGFETVTIAYEGKIAHHDSAGNSGIIGPGEVQWMTAASGILHKEYHELEYSTKGGPFQMIQLWVNLPAKDKMSKPKYQGITADNMGKYELAENKGSVDVIAGTFKGVKGPAFTFSPIEAYNARLKKGAVETFSFPENFNTGFLVVEGTIKLNGETQVPKDHFVLFKNIGEDVQVEATEDTVILMLSGEPINEPIVAHGPFLMNTREEIIQAFNDVNMGKFGYLED